MKKQNLFTAILWLIVISFLSSPFLFGQEDSHNKWAKVILQEIFQEMKD